MAILLVFLSASSAVADGGSLRLSRVAGELRISVFTSPTPLRAGTVDASVLVQDAKTGRVRPGVPVRVRASPVDSPAAEVEADASHDLATNKLLQAAHLELDRPGRWRLWVAVGEAVVDAEVEVAGAAPPWWGLAPWVGWPFAVVALFVARQLLVRGLGRAKS
jgi:hypothetical protein